MTKIKLLLLFLFAWCISFAQEAQKAHSPGWVTKVNIPEANDSLDGGGIQYLLYNNQINFEKDHSYFQHAIKLLSYESVEDYSTLSFSFDPSFQKVQLHEVVILRDGKRIDKLSGHHFETFRRETSMERSIYDGSLTSVVNLSDVRRGDVLLYSYSYIGRNSAFAGHIYDYQNLQFGTPVGRLYYRLLGASKQLKYELYNGADKPTTINKGNEVELLWDLQNVSEKKYFSNTPSWYNRTPHVGVSNYSDWNEVLEEVLPYYELSAEDKKFLEQESKKFKTDNDEQSVLNAIRFVQDDIRYLGFEDGLHAYKPHNVKEVYNQRFGDCKDKSFLLSGMLSAMGYEAYPILVNTRERKSLLNGIISPYSFDHCVVKLVYNDQSIYIDPTQNEQGGDLYSYNIATYGAGLVLAESSSGLEKMDTYCRASTYVIDEFTIPEDFSEAGTYVVSTEYHGYAADDVRAYFNNSSKDEVKSDYLNYYIGVFSHIRMEEDIEIEDDRERNIIKTKEHYIIDSIWNTSPSGVRYVDVYALQVRDLVNYDRENERNAPVYISPNKRLKQLIKIHLPDSWSVTQDKLNIDKPGYKYDYSALYNEAYNLVIISHDYSTNSDHVSGEDYNEFIEDHDAIMNSLSFQISKPDGELVSAGFPYYLAGLGIALLIISAIAISLYVVRRIFLNYDPGPASWAKGNKGIGGWLILPAIGVVLTPVVIAYNFFQDASVFSPQTWIILLSPSEEAYSPATVFWICYEVFANIFLLAYSIFCATQFFKKRTSVPNLMSGLYILSFLIVAVDNMIGVLVMDWSVNDLEMKLIIRGILAVAIWVPYFQISDRVKETFNRQRVEKEEIAGEEEVESAALEV